MSHDGLTDFESDHWDTLAEGFIKKNQEKFDEYVWDEYGKFCNYEPPEREDR